MHNAKTALWSARDKARRMQNYHESRASQEMRDAQRYKSEADTAERGLMELSGLEPDTFGMSSDDFRRMRYMQAHYQ